MGRIELPCLSTHASETCAATNYATCPDKVMLLLVYQLTIGLDSLSMENRNTIMLKRKKELAKLRSKIRRLCKKPRTHEEIIRKYGLRGGHVLLDLWSEGIVRNCLVENETKAFETPPKTATKKR